MGEAKRRAAAPLHATTSAGQMLRKLNEAVAKLPPAPMNGATALDLSPGDYDRVAARLEPSFTGVSTFFGLPIRRSALLIDGIFIGRRAGKPVWSNVPAMQQAIDTWGDPFGPPADPRSPARPAPGRDDGETR